MTKIAPSSAGLARHFEIFIEDELAAGHYASRDAVLEAGLRLLEEREAKIRAIRQALKDGEDSGPPEAFDRDVFLAECRREWEARRG